MSETTKGPEMAIDPEKKYGVPPGWDWNPSSLGQRLPIAGLALAGWVSVVIFPDASSSLTTWSVHHMEFVAFLTAFVLATMGHRRRWATFPWLVFLFALHLVLLAALEIALTVHVVIEGPLCWACLSRSCLAILMIGPAMDEPLAALQYLKRQWRKGRSVWRAVWGLRNRRRRRSEVRVMTIYPRP